MEWRPPFSSDHLIAESLAEEHTTPSSNSALEQSTPAPSHTEWKPSNQVWLIIAGQTTVVFVVSLDTTILTTSLPTVAEALDANAIEAFWIVVSYLLANAVVQPLMAAFADIFGRRSTCFTSLILFTIGTIVCCTAHGVPQLLVGRTVQGIGGGGIFSLNMIILSDIIPLRYLSKYVGLIQLINSLAINLGPVVGSALIKVSWEWLFYINFPFCAIGLAVTPYVLRYVRPGTTVYDKLNQIDWIGSLALIAGLTAFLTGVIWGGNQYAWSSSATLLPLLGGLAVVVLTGIYERYRARNPFLRLSLFRSTSAVAAYVCTMLQSLTVSILLYPR